VPLKIAAYVRCAWILERLTSRGRPSRVDVARLRKNSPSKGLRPVVRLRITDGRSPARVIPALCGPPASHRAANTSNLTQQTSISSASVARRRDAKGDPGGKYMMGEVKISDVHRMVRAQTCDRGDRFGNRSHASDLEGAWTKRSASDAVRAPENSHRSPARQGGRH